MKTPINNLINEELKNLFNQHGSQAESTDPMVIAKFFNPSGAGTWYAISYDPWENICFGYVTGLGCDELGYFDIEELESVECPPFGLRIERDLYFSHCKLSEITGNDSWRGYAFEFYDSQ